MVRENMRSPRAVFQFCHARTTLQGGFLLGFDSRPRTDILGVLGALGSQTALGALSSHSSRGSELTQLSGL